MNIFKTLGVLILGFFYAAGCIAIFNPKPLYSYIYMVFFGILYLTGVVFFQTERILQKMEEFRNKENTNIEETEESAED